jgi:ATP adenylyltransferase/5',5'''-P-1,P-4-tetraphosphate phosphorylase II
MYCPDERLIITKLNGGTHDLALNMFCVDRPQLMMLTTDSYRRQHETLDTDDFKAMLETMRKMPSMYTIYNCSEAGGCSRVHKHLQGLRGPPFAFDALVHATDGSITVPFQYFLHHFDTKIVDVSVIHLLETYNSFLNETRTTLGLGKEETCPHNVVLWDDALIVIPRRKGIWNGASANTGGMMGSIWVPDRTGMDKWLQVGCANVLRQLGVPR